jgi:hypothetical protein
MANRGGPHVPRARAKPKTYLPNGASIAREKTRLISCNVRFVRPEPTRQLLRLWQILRTESVQELSVSGS